MDAATITFADAVVLIESTSIQEWARRNQEAWLTFIRRTEAKDVTRLSTYIVCMAMGL